jgi:hypothetical protein
MKDYKKLVWLLFLAVVVIRIAIAFSSPYFDYDSYFHIRQIENIAQTGLPAYNDPLSYGGGFFLFPPLFHYVMAIFSVIIPIGIVGKIIPNLLYALLVPLSYYIATEITENKKLSLIVPVVVAFMPVLWSNVFSVNPLCLAIPLIFYSFYCLVKEDEKHRVTKFLACSIISAFATPVSILIIPIFWLYMIFLKIEKINVENKILEAGVFSTFFIVLTQFLFYKNAILLNGMNIIWQNIPAEIIKNYFAQASILGIIANIGILPFIFGLYEIYVFSFEKKERVSALFISAVLIVGVLIWAKLLPLQTGLILLGMSISVIAVKPIKNFLDYFQKIKFKNARIVIITVVILFLLSASIPSFTYIADSKKGLPTRSEMNGFLWLRDNSSENSVVIAGVNDGFLLNYAAERKNLIDRNFLMNSYAEERFQDVSTMYTTDFETRVLELLNEYDAKYIFFGKNVKQEFNSTKLPFEDRKCFSKVFDQNETQIYKTWCELE